MLGTVGGHGWALVTPPKSGHPRPMGLFEPQFSLNCELNSQQLPGGLLGLELAHGVRAPCTVCIARWLSKGAAGRWAGVCPDPQQHGLPDCHAERQQRP